MRPINRRKLLHLLSASLAAIGLLPFVERLEKGVVLFGAEFKIPSLKYLTRKEYEIAQRITPEILPEPDVLKGEINPALQLDGFLSRFPAYNLKKIRTGFVFLNGGTLSRWLVRMFAGAGEPDRVNISKFLLALGYYGDANGEADLPPERRKIWKRIGYPGPSEGAARIPPKKSMELSRLPDRLEGRDPLRFAQ